MNKTLAEIKADPEVGKKIQTGSTVLGIENFEAGGKMIIKTILYCHWKDQWALSRRFRYLLKKNIEQAKISLA